MKRVTFGIVGSITAIALLLLFLAHGCANVTPSAQREQCRQNLKTLYTAIVRYISAKGDLPHDENGKVSLKKLAESDTSVEYRIDPALLKCPLTHRDYLVNPELSAADFGDHSRTIVVCDEPANHEDSMLLLLGDGAVPNFTEPLRNRKEWAKSFLAGEEKSRTFIESSDGTFKPQEKTRGR